MRKILSALLIIALCVSVLALNVFAAESGAMTASASANQITAGVGGTVNAQISLTSNPGVMVLSVTPSGATAGISVKATGAGMGTWYTSGTVYMLMIEPESTYTGAILNVAITVDSSVAAGDYTITFTGSGVNEAEERVSFGAASVTVKVVCDHDWGSWTGTQATCGAAGNLTRICSKCDGEETVTPAATGNHIWGSWTGTQATCGAAGNLTRSCVNCTATETSTPAATGDHNWGSWTGTQATCGAAGNLTRSCVNCTATETSTPAATGEHQFTKYEKLDATNHKVLCTGCDKETTEVHTWDAGVTVPATCKDNGKTTYTCTDCKETKVVTIPATGKHIYTDWTPVVGTDNHTHVCTLSGCTASETKPHSWKGEITTQPSCKDDGVMTYTCTGCSATKTDVIEATGEHVYVNWTKVDDNEHKGTCGCGATKNAAHKWNNGVITTQPTCKNDGVKTFTCSDCNGTKTEVIKATGEHVYTNWTKVDDNKHEGTCGCGTKTTEAHKWDAGKVTTDATCGKDGVKTFGCSVCKGTKTEAIKATGKHDYTKSYKDNGDGTHAALCACGAAEAEKHDFSVEGPITVKPSTSNAGKQDILCVCGAKTVKTLPQLPADLDEVPKTGDVTIQITMGVAAMISMAAAAAFVFKRKIAK